MTQIIDTPKVTGIVTLKHYDKDGNLISQQTSNNLVVTTGLNYIAARMSGTTITQTHMTHMALGADNTATSLGQTALLDQKERVAVSPAGGTVSGNTITYTATFPAAGGSTTNSMVEAGIFNASTSGTMLCRTVFGAINKGPNDSLVATWVITIS